MGRRGASARHSAMRWSCRHGVGGGWAVGRRVTGPPVPASRGEVFAKGAEISEHKL